MNASPLSYVQLAEHADPLHLCFSHSAGLISRNVERCDPDKIAKDEQIAMSTALLQHGDLFACVTKDQPHHLIKELVAHDPETARHLQCEKNGGLPHPKKISLQGRRLGWEHASHGARHGTRHGSHGWYGHGKDREIRHHPIVHTRVHKQGHR
jgi:hypothetical protein